MNAKIGKVSVLLLLGAFLLVTTVGCGRESAADSAATQRVYFDRESKQPVVAEAALATPVVNPATGRRTLLPALYCSQCQSWRAAAPLEEVQRNPQARRCLKCKGPLSADGPLPSGADAG